MKTNLIYYNIKASKPSILKTDPHLRYQNKKKHTKLIEFPRQKYVKNTVQSTRMFTLNHIRIFRISRRNVEELFLFRKKKIKFP